MPLIFHSADLHLDSPFLSLPQSKAQERREEQLDAFSRLIQTGNDVGMELLLLSGDLFDRRNTTFETVKKVMDELKKANCQVFIAPGNHDYFGMRSPYSTLRLPDNVHVFKSPEIECVEIPKLGCAVYGAGFDQAYRESSLLTGFRVKDPSLVNIMVMHGEVTQTTSKYNPLTGEDIAASGLDYLALGHVHEYSGLRFAGKTAYAWPGCIEARGFDEEGDRGAIIGYIAKDTRHIEFLPLAKRRYLTVKVDLTGVPGGKMISKIKSELPPDCGMDILRIILKGQISTYDQSHIPALMGGIWELSYHVFLKDETTTSRNIWETAGDDNLLAEFVRELKRLYDTETDEVRREIILHAAELGIAAAKEQNRV